MYVGSAVVAAALLAAGAVLATPAGRGRLADWLSPPSSTADAAADGGEPAAGAAEGPKMLQLSRQARENLGLAVAPVRVGTYTRTPPAVRRRRPRPGRPARCRRGACERVPGRFRDVASRRPAARWF